MLYRSFQWNSDNEGPQNISDSVNNSDSSEDCMIESEEESDLDEDDVLEVCSCSCEQRTKIDRTLELTKQSVIGELSQTGYVCQTIIPELDKFTQENGTGMIPPLISVAVANYGWILFLAYDAKSNTSTLYKA